MTTRIGPGSSGTTWSSWRSFAEHVSGIVGQVAASLPLLLVTIWIARNGGLESAGRFTVVVGISAAAYATALWGLRTAVVIDRFREFDPGDYLLARIASLIPAAGVTMVGGLWMGVPVLLLLLIITLRTADALIDLGLATTQVRLGTEAALRLYAGFHIIKVSLVALPLGMGFLFDTSAVDAGLLLAAMFVLLILAAAGVRSDLFARRERTGRPRTIPRILAVFGRSRWFALAVVCCAVLTSAPRIVVPGFYQGDLLGVVGVSLSVTTFFGMVFFTTWLRSLPRFESSGQPAVLKSYLVEWLTIILVLAIAARTVLPPVVALVFDFSDPVFIELASAVFVAGVAFAAGMTLANLYKLTPWPWMESLTYVLPIVLLGLSTQILSWPRSMPALLALAGGLLLLGSVPALSRLAGIRASRHR